MTIRVYTPGETVTLIKMVKRTDGVAARYTAAQRQIDLTPYLGNGGSITTVKDIKQPTGGFSVSFSDKPDGSTGDTLYALIEPMDMIEIRASRTPEQFVGGQLPILMRGFVSTIIRSEGVTQDGRPMRQVVIQGQDSGKLFLISQILFEVGYVTDQPYLLTFKAQAATGIDAAQLPVGEFMTQLVTRVMNPKVTALFANSTKQALPFLTDTITVQQGAVVPNTMSNFEGPVWNLVEGFADRPWNEVFIRDEEDGPHFVFRPSPFKDINGNLIMSGAVDPGSFTVDISQIISLNVFRADSAVGNFFWVPPGYSSLDNNFLLSTASMQKGDPLDFAYANNNPALYGVRKMQAETKLVPSGLSNTPLKLSAGQQASAGQAYITWFQSRAHDLKMMNRDNVVFEEGQILCMGSESLVAGQNVTVTRGQLTWTAYVPRVTHSIIPMQTWTTQLMLERATSFLERDKIQGAPYFLEGFRGPYDNA
jgi:hypothetical protein